MDGVSSADVSPGNPAGGGDLAAPPPSPEQVVETDLGAPSAPSTAEVLSLVPSRVTDAKLAAEMEDWQANAAIYERRGWLMLDADERHVDIAFIASVPLVGILAAPVITACVRIDYTNYDLWPPSVTFIDPRTRQPSRPPVRAPGLSESGVRDALVENHPLTGLPFLCLPGIREYHIHPQHTGDDWLLHRASGAGRIAVICERIWQRMVLNVVGMRVTVQVFPPEIGTQLEVAIAQGDTSAIQLAAVPNQGGDA